MSEKKKPHILLTRPLADCQTIKADIEACGCHPVISPLLDIENVEYQVPALDYEGYIFTSRYGVRAFDFSKPVYTSGTQTAEKAKELGYNDVHISEYGAEGIEDLIKKNGQSEKRLLYISAADISHMFPKNIERIIAYEAKLSEDISVETKNMLINDDIEAILFYSKRTAAHFCTLVDCKVLKDHVRFICISETVADVFKNIGYQNIVITAQPTHENMMKALSGG